MGRSSIIALVVCVLACFAAAGIGGLATRPGEWYASIAKPSFTPPNWLFGPVWTLLYAMMAVAVWLVWERRMHAPVGWALAVFSVQLVLNALWSVLFFGLHRPGAALIDLALLWLAILASIVLFWRVSIVGAWMLVPYLAWVSFAAVLNASIWWLNR